MPRAVVLFSGSLDSMLAARLLESQGVQVEALFVRTPWGCGNHAPAAAAERLRLPLVTETAEVGFFEPLACIARHADKATQFCGECHLYLARQAKRRMDEVGADFVATGDVLGQRAANQKRIDFERVAHHSGLRSRFLWPLSAKLLTPTLPEQRGWVNREQLGAFRGRSRSGLKALAREFGLPTSDSGQHGCPLGQTGEFGQRVLNQIRCRSGLQPGDFELLRLGHHIRVDAATRIVLGRRQAENDALEGHWSAADCDATYLLRPLDFPGPTALVIGPETAPALDLAVSSIMRYAKRPPGSAGTVLVIDRGSGERRFTRQFSDASGS